MRKVNLIAVLAVVGSVAMSVPAFAGDCIVVQLSRQKSKHFIMN